MNQIDEYLKHAIRFNIAQSGMAPAITIGLSGVIIFFYKFACIEFATAIQICAVMLFILCCLRIGLISKIKKNKKITDSQWLYFASNVALAGACFATVLTLASYELKFHGTDYAIVLAALCGFVTASLITVGSDALLVAVVQFTIFLPSIIVMMIDHFTVQQFGNGSLIFFYSLFLFCVPRFAHPAAFNNTGCRCNIGFRLLGYIRAYSPNQDQILHQTLLAIDYY
jgi:hypothetical protein